MSNSQKMSMEERLAQRLKDSELGAFFEDDDLIEIVKRAVERAFFTGRDTGGYNSTRKPPIIVEMAEEIFREAMKEYVAEAAKVLVAKPEFRELAGQYMVMALPQVLRESMQGMVFNSVSQMSHELEGRLKTEMSQTFAAMANR